MLEIPLFFSFSLAMSSLQYERLCLLFNIGVLQGQIAAAQNFQSDEGLKTAAKMFQVNVSNISSLGPAGNSFHDFPALRQFQSHLKFLKS